MQVWEICCLAYILVDQSKDTLFGNPLSDKSQVPLPIRQINLRSQWILEWEKPSVLALAQVI